MFLLDTDALSELEKPQPDPGLLAWLETVEWLDLHLSVITIGEVWAGTAALPPSRKRRALEAMFDLIPDRFFNRIIPVDCAIAVKFGELQAAAGPLPSLDALIPRDGPHAPPRARNAQQQTHGPQPARRCSIPWVVKT